MMQTELELFRNVVPKIEQGLKRAFADQGHALTGGWERSLTATVSPVQGGVELAGYGAFYGSIVNAGVTPDRIPFGGAAKRGAGNGGVSLYIQGLMRYWMARGLGEREAIRAAFATAHVQKREGMSTEASKRYSATGQRQRFLAAMNEAIGKEVDDYILNGIDAMAQEKLGPKEVTY